MPASGFFWLTIVGGSLFACALLWAIIQWLKADEESEAAEQEIQRAIEDLEAAGRGDPHARGGPEEGESTG